MTSRADAERAEEAAFAAIGELGRRELDEIKSWIASGCEGPQPRPNAEARRELNERLARAIAAQEAAEKVGVR
jgi:hypothetical protein